MVPKWVSRQIQDPAEKLATDCAGVVHNQQFSYTILSKNKTVRASQCRLQIVKKDTIYDEDASCLKFQNES